MIKGSKLKVFVHLLQKAAGVPVVCLVGFASDEIKFIPSYAEHISYAKRISYCVAIFHSFRQERISLKKARRSVCMRRRHFTMRSITSCTGGALHVPQGTLSFKTGGVSNCGHLWSLHLCICGRMWSAHRAPTLFDHL